MSPRRSSRDIDAVSVRVRPTLGTGTAEEGGGRLDGGLLLRARQVVEVDDPGLDYLVTLTVAARDGRMVAEEVRVTARPDGPPVNGAGLRSVTVDAYLALAWRALAGIPFLLGRDTGDPLALVPAGPEDAEPFEREQGRRRSAGQELPRVAEEYRRALASLDPRVRNAPTAEVARRLYRSRGHAARLVTQARAAGLLGPARPGRAGERVDDEGQAEGQAEGSRT